MAEAKEEDRDDPPEQPIPEEEKNINFFNVWCIPNVLLYALSFFALKFATYAVMYFLPTFLDSVYGFSSQQ